LFLVLLLHLLPERALLLLRKSCSWLTPAAAAALLRSSAAAQAQEQRLKFLIFIFKLRTLANPFASLAFYLRPMPLLLFLFVFLF
jgi:hypothetical protein